MTRADEVRIRNLANDAVDARVAQLRAFQAWADGGMPLGEHPLRLALDRAVAAMHCADANLAVAAIVRLVDRDPVREAEVLRENERTHALRERVSA